MSNKGFKGFTLAEVLITLGVIGIVAAMTMPALIANHQKKEVVTKLKKVYTTVNQAIMLTNVEMGDTENWAKDCGGSNSPTCSGEDIREWYLNTIGKHLQSTNVVAEEDRIFIYFNDGSILSISPNIRDMAFYTSKKALTSTSAGKNLFTFRFNDKSGNETDADKGKMFEPYTWNWNGTREGLFNGNNTMYGCNRNAKSYCAKLIQYDGWQISKDYPW